LVSVRVVVSAAYAQKPGAATLGAVRNKLIASIDAAIVWTDAEKVFITAPLWLFYAFFINQFTAFFCSFSYSGFHIAEII
jgi:hypothetical protein